MSTEAQILSSLSPVSAYLLWSLPPRITTWPSTRGRGNYNIFPIHSIMQNKPNFRKSQMNVNPYNTTDYENKWQWRVRKNKPNSNPISEKPKMSANAFSQKDYENETTFRPRKNKPNSNPIKACPERSRMGQFTKSQNECKLICYRGLQQKR